jgi:hypothetical protein
MARRKGAKNKRTLLREEQVRQAAIQAAAGLDRHPRDADCLAIMEEAMRYFHAKAWTERFAGNGKDANEAVVAANYRDAVAIAKDVARFRHPILSAVKLAGDPNNPLRAIRDDITADELCAEILAEMVGLGILPAHISKLLSEIGGSY